VNRLVPVAILAIPIVVIFLAALISEKTDPDWPMTRLTEARPTAAPTPTATPAFRSERELRALEVIDAGAICSTGDVEDTPAPWSDRIVLVDVTASGAIDPSTALGPTLNPDTADELEFVSIMLRKPVWDLSPGDVVTLVAVPHDRPGTPTPVASEERFPRVDGVTVITVPWDPKSEPGTEGQALVALPAGNDAFVDIAAAESVGVPVGRVPASPPQQTPTPESGQKVMAAPTIELCPTPIPTPIPTT
jgi:hypothetical protein